MIGSTDLLHLLPAPYIKTLQVFLIYCQQRPNFSTIKSCGANVATVFAKV
jgi:hypothetical protein